MKHLFIFIAIATIFFYCKKLDRVYPDSSVTPKPYIDSKVNASIYGIVVDEKDQPVENAVVRAGKNYTSTNARGYFFFDGIETGKNASSVAVEHLGYFKGNRTFMATEGGVYYVKIQLIPQTVRGRFQSGAGGQINIEKGGQVEFAPNSFIFKYSELPYQGEVIVEGAYIDPADPKISSIMPGNLMGLDTANNLLQLKTFGMMAIELKDAAGEELDLAPRKTAIMRFPIPASMLKDAPATIPLWNFDDTTGLWRKEGIATKEGNMYVGEVAHFSSWNLDVPNDFITLKMKLTNGKGLSMPFHTAKITNTRDGAYSFATTDSAGVVEGAVSLNAVLLLEVYDFCGKIIASQQIGPFSSSTDLGKVVLNIPTQNLLTISGSAKNCLGGKVINGYADIFLDGMYHRAKIVDGNFSIVISRCETVNATAEVTVTDLDAGQRGDPYLKEISTGTHELGNMVACGGAPGQYINFTLDDTIHFGFAPPADVFFPYLIITNGSIQAHRKDQPGLKTSMQFRTDSIPGGNYLHDVTVNNGKYNLVGVDGRIFLEVTGGRQEYLSGNMTINMRDSIPTNVNIYKTKINFQVRRY
jgi:hypothetical protein